MAARPTTLHAFPNINEVKEPARDEAADYAYRPGELLTKGNELVSCLGYSNRVLYAGFYNGEVVTSDPADRKFRPQKFQLNGPDGKPFPLLAMDTADGHLIGGSDSGVVGMWRLDNRTCVSSWQDHSERISSLRYVDGDKVYSTGHDGYFRVRNVEHGFLQHSFISCACPVSSMAIQTSDIVYVGSWDGQIKQLDLRQKAWIRVLKCEQAGGGDSPIRCLAVATAPHKPGVRRRKNAPLAEPTYLLFAGHGIGEIRSWDMRAPAKPLVESYQGHADVVNSIVVCNNRLYSASDDRTIRIFDVEKSACLETLVGHSNGVTSLAVASISAPASLTAASTTAAAAAAKERIESWICSGSFDRTVRAYKVASIEAGIMVRQQRAEEEQKHALDAWLKSKRKKSKKRVSKAGIKKKSGSKKKSASAGTKLPSATTPSGAPTITITTPTSATLTVGSITVPRSPGGGGGGGQPSQLGSGKINTDHVTHRVDSRRTTPRPSAPASPTQTSAAAAALQGNAANGAAASLTAAAAAAAAKKTTKKVKKSSSKTKSSTGKKKSGTSKKGAKGNKNGSSTVLPSVLPPSAALTMAITASLAGHSPRAPVTPSSITAAAAANRPSSSSSTTSGISPRTHSAGSSGGITMNGFTRPQTTGSTISTISGGSGTTSVVLPRLASASSNNGNANSAGFSTSASSPRQSHSPSPPPSAAALPPPANIVASITTGI